MNDRDTMTTTTPDNEPLELGEPDSLAGTFADQIATLKRELAAAREELAQERERAEKNVRVLRIAGDALNELYCAYMNGARSERAFEKYAAITERAKDACFAAIAGEKK